MYIKYNKNNQHSNEIKKIFVILIEEQQFWTWHINKLYILQFNSILKRINIVFFKG